LGIAPNILTRRLADLTAKGLLGRHRYSERPPRYEYRLTEAGKDFLPVLYVLGAWGRKHFSKGDVTGLVDATSGKAVVPIIIDRTSGTLVADMDLQITAAKGVTERLWYARLATAVGVNICGGESGRADVAT
jgi:hypothetical protein